MRLSRLLGFVVTGALALLVLTWLAAVLPVPLLPANWAGLGVLLAICLVLGIGALVARACALTFERGRMRGLMATGMLLAALAIAGWTTCMILPLVTSSVGAAELSAVGSLWISAGAIVIGAVAAVYRARISDAIEHGAAALVMASIGIPIAAVPLLATWTFVTGQFPFEQYFLIRQAVFVALVAMVTTSATLAAVRLRIRLFGQRRAVQDTVRVRCPRCGAEAALAMGGAHCGACGLRIVVEEA